MALRKNMDDPYGSGVVPAYIKLAQVNLSFADATGMITFNIYKDNLAYQAGKPPVTQINFVLGNQPASGIMPFDNMLRPGSGSPVAAFNALRTFFYNTLKRLPNYDDTTDVIDI